MAQPVGRTRPDGEPALRLRLRREGQGDQCRWQADLLGAPSHASQHFDSLPELIAWLARLEWQSSVTRGLR